MNETHSGLVETPPPPPSHVPDVRRLVAEPKLVFDDGGARALTLDALEDVLPEVEEERLLELPQAALLDVDRVLAGA